MTNIAELLIELSHSKELLNIIVHKRRNKMLVRWILGAIFYISLWHISWVPYLFWIGLPLELILLAITIVSYYRLNAKIEFLEKELASATVLEE